MDKENFKSYYEYHYKPLLESLSEKASLSDKEKHLITFLMGDIEEIFFNEDVMRPNEIV